MQKCFSTPMGANVQVDIKEDKIGSGERGAKSYGLKAFQPMLDSITWKGQEIAEERRLATLPLVSLTPALFKNYLAQCGASYENKETPKAILGSPFTSEILEGIGEAASPFPGLYAAIRSDEQIPIGFGLLHTGFVLIDDAKKAVEKIASEIKEILIADFSENMRAFKERLGLKMDQHAGAFLQPVAGCFLGDAYATLYHINAITNFRGNDALLNIGCGLGGANKYRAKTMFASSLMDADFTERWEKSGRNAINVLSNGEFGVMPENLYSAIKPAALGYSDNLAHDANSILSALSILRKSLYVEAGWGETEKRRAWHILQIGFMELKAVAKPDIAEDQIVMKISDKMKRKANFGTSVCGRGTVDSEHVFFIKSYKETHKFLSPEFVPDHPNKTLKNYALIYNIGMEDGQLCYGAFAGLLQFAAYSNAAAIIVDVSSPNGNYMPNANLLTHMDGAARAAGIPIIAGRLDDSFRASLKPGINNIKLQIYANDAAEEALVAKTG